MANQQGQRQDEREATTMAKSGDGGERGLATRQYQDPLSMLDSLFERMQRDFFGTTLLHAMLPAGAAEGDRGVVRVPRMQMRDNDDAIELTAELPGIELDKVKVELEDDTLTISGEAEAKEEREDARIERYVGFYRQIPLPDSVDADQPIRLVSQIGETLPLHCTAPGKAHLAFASEEELKARVPDNLKKFTASTITERQALMPQQRQADPGHHGAERPAGWPADGTAVGTAGEGQSSLRGPRRRRPPAAHHQRSRPWTSSASTSASGSTATRSWKSSACTRSARRRSSSSAARSSAPFPPSASSCGSTPSPCPASRRTSFPTSPRIGRAA